MIYVDDIQREALEAGEEVGEKAHSADAGSMEKGSVTEVPQIAQ